MCIMYIYIKESHDILLFSIYLKMYLKKTIIPFCLTDIMNLNLNYVYLIIF